MMDQVGQLCQQIDALPLENAALRSAEGGGGAGDAETSWVGFPDSAAVAVVAPRESVGAEGGVLKSEIGEMKSLLQQLAEEPLSPL